MTTLLYYYTSMLLYGYTTIVPFAAVVVWHGVVCSGVMRCALVWCGVLIETNGVVWCCVMCCGALSCAVVCLLCCDEL